MASTMMPSFLVGSTFGASLLVSGVASPDAIIHQFTLQDFHMLIAFLTASSISAVVVYVSNTTGFAKLPPRSGADYGWLGRYGANVVGGLMQGVAMAVTGACPGTVLVQVAMGWGMGSWVMLGNLLGGVLFNVVGDRLRVVRRVDGRGAEVKTIQERVGISTEAMLMVYEAVMSSVVVAATTFAPLQSPWRQAVVGGCLIGIAQASSVLLARKTLGVSTAYQDVAGHVLGLFGLSRSRPGWGSIVFVTGVMAGAKVVGQYLSVPHHPGTGTVEISTLTALAGGIMSIFGARLAGGCTSGHGISGCATLSVSSLITVAAMFGGGIAFKMLTA